MRYVLPREGQRVGGYRIVKKLGEGSFGTVFLARRRGRWYALKLLRSWDWVRWAEREVEVLRRLRHPNIVRFFGYDCWPDEEEGLPYLVLEYLPGETMEARARRAPYTALQVVEWVLGVAEGLAEAHRHQVVHRDVKPANVLLREGSGQAVLMDFGVAHLAGVPKATWAGIPPGTREYRSPEVWRAIRARDEEDRYRARPMDDWWALGVTLYELLTGKQPFRGEASSVLEQVPVAPQVLTPGVPEALSHLCLRMLEKVRGARLADEVGVLEGLRALRAQADATWRVPLGVTLPPEPPRLPALFSPDSGHQETEEALDPPGGDREPPQAEPSSAAPPPPPSPAPGGGRLWQAVALMALGLALGLLAVLLWRPPPTTLAVALPLPGPPAATRHEVAPRGESSESAPGAAPSRASISAPVAPATTPPGDTDVKAKPRDLKKWCLSLSVAAAALQAGCAPFLKGPRYELPGTEPCPPHVLQAMEARGLLPRMIVQSEDDTMFDLLEHGSPHAVHVRHGQQVSGWTPPLTTGLGEGELRGRLYVGRERVYVRFTEFHPDPKSGGGAPFAVCMDITSNTTTEEGDILGHHVGVQIEQWFPEQGTVTVFNGARFRVVDRFPGGDHWKEEKVR